MLLTYLLCFKTFIMCNTLFLIIFKKHYSYFYFERHKIILVKMFFLKVFLGESTISVSPKNNASVFSILKMIFHICKIVH